MATLYKADFYTRTRSQREGLWADKPVRRYVTTHQCMGQKQQAVMPGFAWEVTGHGRRKIGSVFLQQLIWHGTAWGCFHIGLHTHLMFVALAVRVRCIALHVRL